MKQEIKAQWVAALRSGTYRQCQHALHNEDGFCCLGVLTDLYLQAHGKQWEDLIDEDTYGKPCYSLPDHPDDSEQVLPPEVMLWAGLAEFDPRLPESGRVTDIGDRASDLNDQGVSFSRIADLVERAL